MCKQLNLDKNYYNQKGLWDKYINNKYEIIRARETIRFIPQSVKSIIDIGCGNGTVTDMIDKPFVVGLDFARIPLSNSKCRIIQASIDSLPIKSGKFDLVILTEVLEHLSEDVFIGAIEDISRLRPKYILITVPFNENIEVELAKCNSCGNRFNINHHYRAFIGNWCESLFPDYTIECISYASYRNPPNLALASLRKTCGVFTYSKFAVCNNCGGTTSPSNNPIKFIFNALNLIDICLKKLARIEKPYHQIILLKLKSNESD